MTSSGMSNRTRGPRDGTGCPETALVLACPQEPYSIIKMFSSYNSTGGAGLRYGIRMLHSNIGLKRLFESEIKYLDSIDPEILKDRFKITATDVRKYTARVGKSSKFTSYPRDHGEDPWHVMDFSQMMEFAATRPAKEGKNIGYMTDGHFVPYYHQRGISPCTMQYDVIIKQEFFGQEFGHLLGKKLGPGVVAENIKRQIQIK